MIRSYTMMKTGSTTGTVCHQGKRIKLDHGPTPEDHDPRKLPLWRVVTLPTEAMRQDGGNDLTAGGYPLTIRVMAKPQVNTTDEILGTDTVPRVSSGRPRLTLPRWGAELSGVPEVIGAYVRGSWRSARMSTGSTWP